MRAHKFEGKRLAPWPLGDKTAARYKELRAAIHAQVTAARIVLPFRVTDERYFQYHVTWAGCSRPVWESYGEVQRFIEKMNLSQRANIPTEANQTFGISNSFAAALLSSLPTDSAVGMLAGATLSGRAALAAAAAGAGAGVGAAAAAATSTPSRASARRLSRTRVSASTAATPLDLFEEEKEDGKRSSLQEDIQMTNES